MHTLFEHEQPEVDPGLKRVAEYIISEDENGDRIARVLRDTFDQLYDGQRTGRYKYSQLHKTEKTHFGTLVEINIQREFKFRDGDLLDFSIAGEEVDCKFSFTKANWMLPPESFGRLIFGLWASDEKSSWSAGLVRVTPENRRVSANRDQKTGLSRKGKLSIEWLFDNKQLKPNALIDMGESRVERLMREYSGQRRVNALLREAPNRRLSRTVIATVAQQLDPMKRVRANGGAREILRPEGILVLAGDYRNHQEIARDLGAEVPSPGEVVSVYVMPSDDGSGAFLDGAYWRCVKPGETPSGGAPRLPRQGEKYP